MKAFCESVGLTPDDLHIRLGRRRIRAFSPLWYIANIINALFWAFVVAVIIIFG